MTTRVTWLAALLVVPSLLFAQREAPSQRWRFTDQRDGLCVWFLADAATLAEGMPRGVAPRAASGVTELPASLTRVLADEPRFAAWTPGVVCAERFGSVQLGDDVVGRARDDGPGHVLTMVALATEGGAGWTVLELGTDVTPLQRRGAEVALRVADRKIKATPGGENEDPTWEIGLDGAKLVWTGHPTGEARVASTRSMSFGYTGNRNTSWSGTLSATGGSERAQVGALRVDGKGWLAKALKASPIRAVGAVATGGTLEVTLSRQSGR